MKHIHPLLYLLISFILADTLCDNLLVQAFNTQVFTIETLLIILYLVVQILIAPIQAGFSDFYCRKKSLAVSLLFSLLSLLFAFLFREKALNFFAVFFIIIFLKGFLGNTIPIAWAAVADLQSKDLRFALAMATAPYALGYLLLNIYNNHLSMVQSNIFTMTVYAILIILCITVFRDLRDERRVHREEITSLPKKLKEEIKLLKEDILDKRINTGLLAYLLWSASLYSVLVLLVDFKTPFHSTASIMMYGYIVGVVVLKFVSKVDNNKIIYLGYIVSIVPFIFYFGTYYFLGPIGIILSISYFFYGMGNAYLSPTILSILSKEKHLHEQGKIFGLIDSVDTLGFLIGSIAILIYRICAIHMVYMIILSMTLFVISIIPFAMNVRLRREPQNFS